ncbi:MAG: DUF4132 domain-containing protein [Deltaproteobacteria bacterium]|nr:DUF4132 domain-containing protein [Deltaproteobacteria bacterium]
MRRFELSEGTSHKFWQIELSGTSFTVTFGRIGTSGQTQTKSFDTPAKAQTEHDKLVKEKVKKGYAEVSTDGHAAAAPVAPKPKAEKAEKPAAAPAAATTAPAPAAAAAPAPTPAAAPSSPEPAAPVVEPGVVWTPEALREVAPRRGWSLVAAKKPDAKSAFAKIREGFELYREPIAKGLLRSDAEADLMRSAIRAFEGDPESKLDHEAQAAAAALVAPRLHWQDRVRRGDFLAYWSAVEGPEFALRALARSATLIAVYQRDTSWKTVEVALVKAPVTTSEKHVFGAERNEAWRALRNAVLLAGDAARPSIEAVAAELRAGMPAETKALVTAALGRSDWAREDIAEGIAAHSVHRGAPAWAWPLLLALPLDEAVALLPTMAGSAWATMQGFDAIRFELVSTFGPSIAPQLITAMKEGASAGTEMLRSVAEALALVVTDEVVKFFLDNLVSKELRAIAASYLSTHAQASLPMVARAATTKGPLADAARAILRRIVASHPEVVAATRSALGAAALTLVEAFEADAAPREEAGAEELPRVLRDPPWKKKAAAPAVKVVRGLSPLPCEEGVAWRPGEREPLLKSTGWLAPRPDERAKTLAAIRAANEAPNAGKSSWQMPGSMLFGHLPDADAPKAFNEANHEKFGWGYYGVLETLAARHGLAVLPGLIRFAAMDLAPAVDALRRVRSPKVAPLMAEAFARLKKSRDLAAEWLLAFPEVAAIGLVPLAVGDPGSARTHAEVALRHLASRGHRDVVLGVAKKHGAEAHDAVVSVLDFDALLLVPKKVPGLPSWFNAAAFTRPLLAGRSKALSLGAVDDLATMLAFTGWEEPYAGLLEVKAACDPRSLADFAWDVFQAWLTAGASSKESWALLALGLFGDDESARKLTPLLRAWPGESAHARAVTGLDVLARIGSDVALMHLHGVAQKVKFKGLQEKAKEKIEQIAEARGLTSDELADRLVPDLGLEDDGTLWLDFGPRKFKVVFDESLKPAVVDDAGKRLPDLPKPKQTDDAEKAKEATELWKAMKKDAKTIAQGQLLRLELAMCSQRRWSVEVFRTFLLEHPLLVHLVRRLVWAVFDAKGKLTGAFRVAEDSSLASAEDDAYELAEDCTVGIAHRLEIGEALAGTWGQVFADYEILQPFEQLARGTTPMADAERAAKKIDRVKGTKVPTGRVLGLDARGWRRGAPQDGGVVCWYEKKVQGGLVVRMDLDPGIFTGMIAESPEQTLGDVTISKNDEGGWYSHEGDLPLGELAPIVYSELVRDLDSLRS